LINLQVIDSIPKFSVIDPDRGGFMKKKRLLLVEIAIFSFWHLLTYQPGVYSRTESRKRPYPDFAGAELWLLLHGVWQSVHLTGLSSAVTGTKAITPEFTKSILRPELKRWSAAPAT
jgi:hypothetical protein